MSHTVSCKHGLKVNKTKTRPILIGYSRLFKMETFSLLWDFNLIMTFWITSTKSNILDYSLTINWHDINYITETCNRVSQKYCLSRFLTSDVSLHRCQWCLWYWATNCSGPHNYCVRFIFVLRLNVGVIHYHKTLRILELTNNVHIIF